MATIQQLAEQMCNQFEKAKRPDGEEFARLKHGHPEWMTDVTREAHDGELPNDQRYDAVEKIVTLLADMPEDGDEDAAREYLQETLEPDVYTNELTKWLGSYASYVDYLTQAITEYGCKDGFQALTMAQQIWLEEIAGVIISKLSAMAKESEE